MSAILGVFAADGEPTPDPTAARMLGAMHQRGADRAAAWRGDGALLAVSRAVWELQPGFADDVLVLADGDLVIAADAAIYYRDDLRRALDRAGIGVARDTASHLILAAYRAWGDACAEHLEGDFAFIIWDRRRKHLCAARDYSGKRPLFYAELGGTTIVASSVSGVLAHPACPSEINLTVVAESACGMFAASHETAYRAIHALPAGSALTRDGASHIAVRRHWNPPPVEPRDDLSFDDAAAMLRAMLERAVAERVPPSGEVSVWLSGGWDSPAVYGAGRAALASRGDARSLRPVSMSYPPGDPGREDELIQAIAEFWRVPVQWVDIRDVPFLSQAEESAALRDEPFAHPFEMWNRMLAQGSRAVGAHVALEGVGGDQLFQVSDVYLADLLRSGRWGELMREWQEEGRHGTGFRNFFRWAIQPLLPPLALQAAALARGGRPLVGYLERRPPSWLDCGFAKRNHIEERERAFTPQRGRNTGVAYETLWYLSYPYFPRVFGHVSALALDEGVEIRSPLYDNRVISFAVTRPRWERSSGRETKRLLRAAVRGLLPDEVLAPRATRTGVTGGYFSRSMRERFPALFEGVMQSSLLAESGMIDAYELKQTAAAYLRGAVAEQVGVQLFFTLQAELWLRARLRKTDGATRDDAGAVPALTVHEQEAGSLT